MSTDGPLRIVAGPGAGKTLTVVRRIAHFIRQGVRPESILAVTFTNRAARELKERTAALLGHEEGKIFIGTFHLLGLSVIRESIGHDIVLLDREEQIEVLKPPVKGSAKKAQYVGMTRAKDELFLLRSRSRFLYGERRTAPASPFLEEILPELMQSTVIPDTIKKVQPEEKQSGLF